MAITAAIGGAAIGAVGSAVAGGEQASAARSAANSQMQMYQQTRNDLLPYMNTGATAFSALGNLMGNGGPAASANMLAGLRNYPGYQWAFDQGLEGVDRSAASRGLLLSGGQLKDVTQYGQGMADQLFGTYYNQQLGLANLGENAAAQTGNAGTTAAGNAGQATMAAGQANASGVAGVANQLGGVLQNQNLLAMFGSGSGSSGGYSGQTQGMAGGLNSIPGYVPTTLSDRRTKDNVVRIGKLDSGLPVYSYRYKGSALPQIGVMAQDVERVAPHAVHTGADGFKRVSYDAVSKLPPMKDAA